MNFNSFSISSFSHAFNEAGRHYFIPFSICAIWRILRSLLLRFSTLAYDFVTILWRWCRPAKARADSRLNLLLQWSLRSNLTPDSKDTCSSCWREKESDDLMMMSSDSGITSPNSHHYDQQSVSPCSISVMVHFPKLWPAVPVADPIVWFCFLADGSITDRWYASAHNEDVEAIVLQWRR